MIFQYEELKKCVEEDFERFYKMGFNENQIFPAVLDEYEHGKEQPCGLPGHYAPV